MKHLFRSLLLGASVLASAVGLADQKGIEGYEDTFTVPKDAPMLLYPNKKLSAVTGISGDFWLFHSNQSDPYLHQCSGPLEPSAKKQGVYHYSYDSATQTAKCQFQARWIGSYTMVAVVELTQQGNDIYAQVVSTSYPWSQQCGYEAAWTGWDCSYYLGLDPTTVSGMTRVSLHKLELEFAAGSSTSTVIFKDRVGTTLSTQEIPYGDPAVAPTPTEFDGYVFHKWDKDFSFVKEDMTVTGLYHKLCTVTFKDADGTTLDTETVEETHAATKAPDMRRAMYQNQEFLRWDNDFSYVTSDLVVTAVYGIEAPKLSPVPAVAAGLRQGKIDKANDFKTDILANSTIPVELVPGTVMADVAASDSSYSTVGYTNPKTGTTYYWNQANTTFGYFGQIYLTAGNKINFAKNVDDSAYIRIGETVVMNNTSASSYIVNSYTATETGWYDFEVRVGDGAGGKGPYGGAIKPLGLGYNINGTETQSATGWEALRDETGSFLRATSTNAYLKVGTLHKDGDNIVVKAAGVDLPVAGTLYACFAEDDKGESPEAWTHREKLATIPLGTSAEVEYTLVNYAHYGAVRLLLVVEDFQQLSPVRMLDNTCPIVDLKGVSAQNGVVSGVVTVESLGTAASSDVTVEIADNEAFTGAVVTNRFVGVTELGEQSFSVDGLSRKGTFYVRATISNGTRTMTTPVVSAVMSNIGAWTTGSYDLTTWTAEAKNLLAVATVSNDAITKYSEGNRTLGTVANLTDGLVPSGKSDYTGTYGVAGGSITWTLKDAAYLEKLSIYSHWGDGGRDGIAISQVLYQQQGTGEWVEMAGPEHDNAVSYGLGDNSSAGDLFATLAVEGGGYLSLAATAIKIVFSDKQDNNGSGYVEIELTGRSVGEVDGGSVVTFVDWDGSELKTEKVPFEGAATPPADPTRTGYKFVGWDKKFDYVVAPMTVTALYHQLFNVTFKDADGTILKQAVAEETLPAPAPDMTGKTYRGEAFLGWDDDLLNLSHDKVFTAVYGTIPAYVDEILESGLVPEDGFVWAGGASGTWSANGMDWVTAKRVPARWKSGAQAVFSICAEVAVADQQTVGGILMLANATNVTFTGDSLEVVAPGTVTFGRDATVRFKQSLTGTGGFTLQAAEDLETQPKMVVESLADFSVTGEINIKAGVFNVLGEGTLFGGDWTAGGSCCESPLILGADGTFEFDSTAKQRFATLVNARNAGNGYSTIKTCSTTGRLVIGPNASNVTFKCSSEGLHRFFNGVDVYGTVTFESGTYHLFCGNKYGITIHDGGVLNVGTGYGVYGHRDQILTCLSGGVVNYTTVQSMGISDSKATFDGGTANFTVDYTSKNDDIAHKDIILKNGALFSGTMMTWGWKHTVDSKLTVDGTSPSTITLEKIRFGQSGTAAASNTKMRELLVVNDVTGDDAADLTVSSTLYKHATATCEAGNEPYFGLVKQGAGTVLFTGQSPDFGASLNLQAGTVAFGDTATLNASALILEGDAALEVSRGSRITFGDSSAQVWKDGATLTFAGVIGRKSVRFGTNANALTAKQLAQIKFAEKPKYAAALNAEGYLVDPNTGMRVIIR